MTGGGPVKPVFRRARDIPVAPTAPVRTLDMRGAWIPRAAPEIRRTVTVRALQAQGTEELDTRDAGMPRERREEIGRRRLSRHTDH